MLAILIALLLCVTAGGLEEADNGAESALLHVLAY